MASQITHVVYGQKVVKKFLAGRKVDEKKFFIGTLFPDIRYLGTIDREKTHFKNATPDGLKEIRDSFTLGRYAHALVDRERATYVSMAGFYKLFPKTPALIYAMKFVEDTLVYPLFSDWKRIRKYLKEIFPEEKEMVSEDIVKKWHEILSEYFAAPPTLETAAIFAKKLDFPNELLHEVKKEYKSLQKNKKALGIIKDTYKNLFIRL